MAGADSALSGGHVLLSASAEAPRSPLAVWWGRALCAAPAPPGRPPGPRGPVQTAHPPTGWRASPQPPREGHRRAGRAQGHTGTCRPLTQQLLAAPRPHRAACPGLLAAVSHRASGRAAVVAVCGPHCAWGGGRLWGRDCCMHPRAVVFAARGHTGGLAGELGCPGPHAKRGPHTGAQVGGRVPPPRPPTLVPPTRTGGRHRLTWMGTSQPMGPACGEQGVSPNPRGPHGRAVLAAQSDGGPGAHGGRKRPVPAGVPGKACTGDGVLPQCAQYRGHPEQGGGPCRPGAQGGGWRGGDRHPTQRSALWRWRSPPPTWPPCGWEVSPATLPSAVY